MRNFRGTSRPSAFSRAAAVPVPKAAPRQEAAPALNMGFDLSTIPSRPTQVEKPRLSENFDLDERGFGSLSIDDKKPAGFGDADNENKGADSREPDTVLSGNVDQKPDSKGTLPDDTYAYDSSKLQDDEPASDYDRKRGTKIIDPKTIAAQRQMNSAFGEPTKEQKPASPAPRSVGLSSDISEKTFTTDKPVAGETVQKNTRLSSFGSSGDTRFRDSGAAFTYQDAEDDKFGEDNAFGAPEMQDFGRNSRAQPSPGGFGKMTPGGFSGAKLPKQADEGVQERSGPARHGSEGFGKGGKPMDFGQGMGSGLRQGDLKVGEQEEKRVPFVPVSRKVEEIFKEDENVKALYENIFDDDEPIIIEGQETVTVMENWNDVGLHSKLLENIRLSKYVKPRKIQAFTIPVITEGKDLKAQAETGSGKSAAFLIPIVDYLIKLGDVRLQDRGKNQPLALVVEPTRELASQLYEQCRKLAYGTGITTARVYGQFKVQANAEEIFNGCDIVVATPGRLRHFIGDGTICPKKLRFLVLDEADRLLDEHFREELNEIQAVSTFPKKENRHNLLFSATFSDDVECWAAEMLKPDRVFVHCKSLIAPNHRVKQFFRNTESDQKKQTAVKIVQQVNQEYKSTHQGKLPRIMVFVERKRDSDVMALFLVANDLSAVSLNGDRPQQLREQALYEFRRREVQVLVTTDVCARGIDVKELDYVVNVDMPRDIVTYVHRIGRTGRLCSGTAISFFDASESNDRELAPRLVQLLKDSNIEPPDFIVQAAERQGGVNASDTNFTLTVDGTTKNFADCELTPIDYGF